MAFPLIPVIGGALGLGSLINSIRQGNQAQGLQEEALDIQRGLFQQGAPLRRLTTDRLLAMLRDSPGIDPRAPSLDLAFQDPTNPFSRPLPRVSDVNRVQPAQGGGAAQPVTPPPPTDIGGALPLPGVRLPRFRGGGGQRDRDREFMF